MSDTTAAPGTEPRAEALRQILDLAFWCEPKIHFWIDDGRIAFLLRDGERSMLASHLGWLERHKEPEPRAYILRDEGELVEIATGTTDTANTARRERIERRAWEFYMRDPGQPMREAISVAILWDETCQELIQ